MFEDLACTEKEHVVGILHKLEEACDGHIFPLRKPHKSPLKIGHFTLEPFEFSHLPLLAYIGTAHPLLYSVCISATHFILSFCHLPACLSVPLCPSFSFAHPKFFRMTFVAQVTHGLVAPVTAFMLWHRGFQSVRSGARTS
eukprot:755126-Hanusia_phi.AAC.4